MTRYALTIEFDGGPFQGLQRQKHGPSIQGAIEAAAHRLTGQEVTLYSAGRTDSGVHALAMRSHLNLEKDKDSFRLMEGLNAHLRPDPIVVTACEVVDKDWHARFSCTGRRYLYRILNRRAPPALLKGRVWHQPRPIDEKAMHEAAQVLVGRHDFTTFRSVNCQSDSPVKSLARLDVERVGEEVHIHAAARSFLHHQVRSMVGCLALVGLGQWNKVKLAEVLEARDRQQLGLNAPAHGLYFVAATYPDDNDKQEKTA